MNKKGFANITLVVLVLVFVGTIGYLLFTKEKMAVTETNQIEQENSSTASETSTATDINPTPTSSLIVSRPKIDNCIFISSSSFRSVNQYEVGLSPNGPAMGYWSIRFQAGVTPPDLGKSTFVWFHSDVGENGTYTCQNNTLQVKLFNRSITAQYDGVEEILTWEGIAYKKVK